MKKYLFLAFFSFLLSCKGVKQNQSVYFFEASEDFIFSHINLKPTEFIEALNQAQESFAHFNIRFQPTGSGFNHVYDPKSRFTLTGSSQALFYSFLITKNARGKNEHKRSFAAEIELLRLQNPTLLLGDSRTIIAPAKFWSDLSRMLNSPQPSMPSTERLKELRDSIWLEYEVQQDTYLPLALDLSRFLEQKDYAIFKAHVISVGEVPSQKDFWVLVK